MKLLKLTLGEPVPRSTGHIYIFADKIVAMTPTLVGNVEGTVINGTYSVLESWSSIVALMQTGGEPDPLPKKGKKM